MRFQAPESLAEQIAQHLSRLIITGEIKPRERIQELKVAGELDVSRGSVREALLLLERRHVIEIYPRKGAVVSDLTVENVDALYDMVEGLIVMLAVKFAERWQPADLERVIRQIQEIISKLASDSLDAEEVVGSGLDLLTLCYPVVDNPYLEETLENFRPAISRTYYMAIKSRHRAIPQSRQFFESLVNVVTKRDLQAIPGVVQVFAKHQKQMVIDALREKSAA